MTTPITPSLVRKYLVNPAKFLEEIQNPTSSELSSDAVKDHVLKALVSGIVLPDIPSLLVVEASTRSTKIYKDAAKADENQGKMLLLQHEADNLVAMAESALEAVSLAHDDSELTIVDEPVSETVESTVFETSVNFTTATATGNWVHLVRAVGDIREAEKTILHSGMYVDAAMAGFAVSAEAPWRAAITVVESKAPYCTYTVEIATNFCNMTSRVTAAMRAIARLLKEIDGVGDKEYASEISRRRHQPAALYGPMDIPDWAVY